MPAAGQFQHQRSQVIGTDQTVFRQLYLFLAFGKLQFSGSGLIGPKHKRRLIGKQEILRLVHSAYRNSQLPVTEIVVAQQRQVVSKKRQQHRFLGS